MIYIDIDIPRKPRGTSNDNMVFAVCCFVEVEIHACFFLRQANDTSHRHVKEETCGCVKEGCGCVKEGCGCGWKNMLLDMPD